MIPGKQILSFSPFLFKSLKRLKRKVASLFYKKFTEEEFKEFLIDRLGLSNGAVVFIHSSIDNLNISFPFYRVYHILLDIVGEEGTLLFPSWHFNYRAEDYLEKNEVFDVRLSPSIMGVLSEFARRQPDAIRSLHPTSSVVAVGKHAVDLTEEHHLSVFPNGPQSPLFKITNYNGIIIGLGVDTEHLSFVHCVEDIMINGFPFITRNEEIYHWRVITTEGDEMIVPTLSAHSQIRNRKVNRYVRKYIPKEICRNFTFRGVKYFVANSSSLYLQMEQLALQGITIYDDMNLKRQ
jgi:aminoglycoside 3-N-acetyltransferase